MRLRLRLPEVRPDEYTVPLSCPYGCGGRYFALHQQCEKELSDPNQATVQYGLRSLTPYRRMQRIPK